MYWYDIYLNGYFNNLCFHDLQILFPSLITEIFLQVNLVTNELFTVEAMEKSAEVLYFTYFVAKILF